MNIVINIEEKNELDKLVIRKFKIGSVLYQTNNKNSDTDILNIYNTTDFELKSALPNYHQFQYKDIENNIDWLYTSELQFWKNFYSGDSTINADVVIFTDLVKTNIEKLELCRTFKVIKSYIGFAKRDLKQVNKDKSKIFHAERGLYTANELINGRLPIIDDIKRIYDNAADFNYLVELEAELRNICNKMYESNELKTYYIKETDNSFLNKLLNSNNIKEFKY